MDICHALLSIRINITITGNNVFVIQFLRLSFLSYYYKSNSHSNELYTVSKNFSLTVAKTFSGHFLYFVFVNRN